MTRERRLKTDGLRCRLIAHLLAALAAAAGFGGLAGTAWGAACQPRHVRPPFFLKTMGPCAFDPELLSFRGEPAAQARCLMRGMDASRNLGAMLESLPPALATRIGNQSGLPERDALAEFLAAQDLPSDFVAHLWSPVSRGNDDDPDAPAARYFVIHDTSGPNYGPKPFPPDIDVNPKINNLDTFKCSDGWGKAHVIINRTGAVLVSHDFSVPWRETRFEQAANFAGALKGLFLHIELIEPRRSAGRSRRNDAQAPDPAFTAVQYDRLALVYAVASVRAGHWLIPAFHAAIDADLRNGHDDPAKFDVQHFADSLEGLLARIEAPDERQAHQ